jgi:hypothetical protein
MKCQPDHATEQWVCGTDMHKGHCGHLPSMGLLPFFAILIYQALDFHSN